jgi:hypothetical protein
MTYKREKTLPAGTSNTLRDQKVHQTLPSTHLQLDSFALLDDDLVPLLGLLDRLGVPEDLI